MSEKKKKKHERKKRNKSTQETEGKCMHQNISEKSAKEKKKPQSFSKIQQHKLTGIYTTHRFGERKGESLRRKTAKKEPLEPREFAHF